MIFEIDPWYGKTVLHDDKIGPRKWRSRTHIFRRDTHQKVGEGLCGEGDAMTTVLRLH